MTASEASRSFSTVLDQAEAGETIVVTRGGRQVATIGPAARGTGRAFRDFLRSWSPGEDPTFDEDMRAARDVVTLDEDPWASG
jgi:prevent-host-death family protein